MDCGSTLTHVHLMNIKVNMYGWQAFSKGLISHSCVIESLKINLVEFDRECLNTLAEGIKHNQSIISLDLSYNNIKDNLGDIFAKIVSS